MERVVTFPNHQTLIEEYREILSGKSDKTSDAYIRSIRQFMEWVIQKPGSNGIFRMELFTKTAVEMFMEELDQQGYSVNHRKRMKSALSGFAKWLIEEKELLDKNPTSDVDIPVQPLMAPRELTDDQRFILRNLVERENDVRGQALFALGYWAGCRVSDVSWLKMDNIYIGPKIGWLKVGYKNDKMREIDILNKVRKPLEDYLESRKDNNSQYVFTSQRADRLTEPGIHHWFRNLRAKATKDEWEYVQDITFHDLRHDFAHRAREGGWTLEEIAYYLGHVTKQGIPAIETTVRYTQAGRKQMKEKLKWIKG
ncbi:tyrosine-type recombinase/integrase [Lentibacillus cibarius]|uniref:Integrase n=1 Tax=Lentibacillus cibarius TaxID=2583219 RepID=A0A5S3QLB0_9BACI|nr:tyrosine-type recombinase/integrase [Lentibacillus cibarius]TMN22724.1 integrase [Lentibacillus cibarius]